jgi:CDP-glucose 4,6-dehydratase
MESLAMTHFWSNKRVLVTGHTGFKGSWLVLWLTRLGADVTGFSLDIPTSPSLYELARVAEGIRDVRGDVRDRQAVGKAIADSQPEIVFHLAAQPLVRTSYEDPLTTYMTNILGTANVLDACRGSSGLRAVVAVTSDKCYENQEWVWGYRETDPLGGEDPYSSSKACAEIVTSAFRSAFFATEEAAAVASARAGNVIGGGDWARDRLIPDAINAFVAGHKLSIRNHNAVRPWQHVLDPLAGYLDLGERLFVDGARFAEAWNFGPVSDDAQPVSWIVDQVAQRWGAASPAWQVVGAPQARETQVLKLDPSKARALLGWRPQLSLPIALDWTVDWYKVCAKSEDMREKTLQQIAAYEQLRIEANRFMAIR